MINMIEWLSNIFCREKNNYIDILETRIEELESKIEKLLLRKETAEQQLQDLINKNKVNVNELQDWYDNKFGSEKWFYKFDGRLAKDVKHALEVTNKGQNIIREESNEIVTLMNVKGESCVEIIGKVMQYYSKAWSYVSDNEYYQMSDYWAPAEVSAVFNKGDCDDLAILMHIIILDLFKMFKLGDNSWRLKFTGGNVMGEGGHAYNIWLHDDGEWYAVESTYDLKGSLQRTWLKTPIKNNNLYVNFWGFARPDRSFKGNSIQSLQKYEDD